MKTIPIGVVEALYRFDVKMDKSTNNIGRRKADLDFYIGRDFCFWAEFNGKYGIEWKNVAIQMLNRNISVRGFWND